MATEIDWDAVEPATDDVSNPAPSTIDPQEINWDTVKPYNPDTSEGLRQRLNFNLQNDYAPDQGNAYDQAVLGIGQGLARLPGAAGGLARYFGAEDTGSRLTRYSQDKQSEYQDLADALGTSTGANVAREAGATAASVVPMLAAGAIGSALGGPAGAAGAFAGIGGLETLGETYNQASEAGYSSPRIPATIAGATSAALNYFIPGGVNGLLEKYAAGALTRTALQQILKEALTSGITLGGLSATDTAAQGLIAKATYDPERTLKEIGSQTLEAGVSGAGLGMFMAAPHLLVRGGADAVSSARKAWEDFNRSEGPAQAEPIPQPKPAGGGTGAREEAPQYEWTNPRTTPVGETDVPKVVLGDKILRAAGFDPEFSQQVAEHFVSIFEPNHQETAEDFRHRLFTLLRDYGVRPEESVGITRRDSSGNPVVSQGNQALRQEQTARNMEALAAFRERAQMVPVETRAPKAETQRPIPETKAAVPETIQPIRETPVKEFTDQQLIRVAPAEATIPPATTSTEALSALVLGERALPQLPTPAEAAQPVSLPTQPTAPLPPARASRSGSYERPPDILDWVEANGGLRRVKPGEKHELLEPWKRAQKAAPSGFKGKSQTPDSLADLYRRETGKDITDEEFLNTIEQVPSERAAFRKAISQTNKEGVQQANFTKVAVENQRQDANKTKQIVSDELAVGDKFDVQGHRFVVSNVRLRPDGETIDKVTLNDGPKFGVQFVGSEAALNIDKGSLRRAKRLRGSATGQRQVATGASQTGSTSPETLPPVGMAEVTPPPTGVNEVRAVVAVSKLSDQAKTAMSLALDALEKSGLDSSKLRLELTQHEENGLAGSVMGSVIRLSESADPSVGPEEVFHLMIESLPESDRVALEAERVANLPPDAPESIRVGTMSTEDFQRSGLPIEMYRWSNLDEYAAHIFADKTASEALKAKNPGLWQRLKDWFAKMWNALKSLVRDPAASERIYQDIQNGTQKYDPPKRMDAAERRGKFVTSESEAEKAVAFAKGAEAKKIEGQEFLAQVDLPVKLMEKYGVPELPGRIRRALGYNEAKGIHEIGVQNNGAPEDYYSIRNRSEDWLKQRMATMANQHVVAFRATLNRAVDEGVQARIELKSPEIRDEIAEMQSRHLSALFYEQAFKNAQVAIKTALNEALELLKKEKASDLRQAQLEAQIRTLKEVGESRVALERLLDDMTSVLLSTPQGEWILKNGGTSEDIGKIYRDIKRSTSQTIVGDQLIGVATYLLSRMPELRNQMRAAEYAKQSGPLAAAWAKLKTLMDQMEKNPSATIERMMREREKLAADASASEVIFRQMQKELTKKLDAIYDRIKTGEVATNILGDPEFKVYADQVQRDARAFGTEKPFEPFVRDMDAPGGVLIEPDGRRVVGLGTDIMMANDALVRRRYNQATESIKRYNDWLDAADPNHALYERHLLDRNALRDYWGSVEMLTPNFRTDPVRWTLSILDKTVTLARGRLMPQVKRAANALNRMSHFAKAWNMKASREFEPKWRAAMKSHGLKWTTFGDNDLAAASKKFNEHFQELANSNQFLHGGLKIGDKSMSGMTVTKEDMAVLNAETTLETEAYGIVQKQDRQITEDTRGLPENVVVYRRAAPVTRFTLPRIPDFDRIPVLDPVANAFRKFEENATPETLNAFLPTLDSIWPTDGAALLGQRNADFSHYTIFDGEGGAFEAIAREIQNGSAFDTFESAAKRVAEISGRPIDETQQIMAHEFGRIVGKFVRALAPASEANRKITVKGGDPTNSFTEERGDQLGPWTFYRTGWASSDEVRATAGHMVAVAQSRLLNGMKAQLADLLRQKKEFEQRQRELDRQGVSSPKSRAARENTAQRRSGQTFDSWLDLDYRISGLENRINEIEDHRVPRTTDVSRVMSRYLNAVTRVLTSAFTTTFRNMGIVFPFRTMHAMGNGQLVASLALWFGTKQAIKMVSLGFGISALKLPYTALKGITLGIRNSIKDKATKELWISVAREFVKEWSTTAQLRIKDVREMIDAGVHIPAEGENEYNNQVADAIYREIPKQGQQLSRGVKIALAPLALAESTFLAAVTAGNPSMGDASVNSTFWNFLKSYWGPASRFKRKASALLKRLDRNYYRTFDLENPTAAENAFEPADLNINTDELSRWRRTFSESGMNFDSKLVEFMKRLKADPKAEFLTRDETVRIANWGIEQFNRQNPTNVANVFRGNNPLMQFVRPLQGWATRSLASFLDYLSVPEHVPYPKTSERMLAAQKMWQWLYKASTAFLFGTLIVGTLSELQLELVTRAYRAVFYNQVSPNRWPWEHEGASKQVMAMARYPAQTIPLLATPINAALPGNTSRATFTPNLVMLEKAKDVAGWVSYGMQTGNWWYKTPTTAAGFYQDIKAITSRTQPGLTLRKNAQALVQRYGPEDTLRKPDFSVPNNLSELSPYGQKLWDAAYRGDQREVMLTAREAMATAKRIGKADPRKAVEDLFRSGNFMSAALSQLPSQTQYRTMFTKLDDSQQQMLREAQANYARAAGWLGFSPPRFVRADEDVLRTNLRRAQNQPPIGSPRLGRY